MSRGHGFIIFPCLKDCLPVIRLHQGAQASTWIMLQLMFSGGQCKHQKIHSHPYTDFALHWGSLKFHHDKGLLFEREVSGYELIIDQIITNPRVIVKTSLSLSPPGHMASFTYIMLSTRFHLCFLQAWLQTVY